MTEEQLNHYTTSLKYHLGELEKSVLSLKKLSHFNIKYTSAYFSIIRDVEHIFGYVRLILIPLLKPFFSYTGSLEKQGYGDVIKHAAHHSIINKTSGERWQEYIGLLQNFSENPNGDYPVKFTELIPSLTKDINIIINLTNNRENKTEEKSHKKQSAELADN